MAVGGRSRVRDGARAILPLAIAVPAFGVSYGVLAVTAGMGKLAPVVMSATTFAGSAQFAAASVLDDDGGVAAAIAAAVLLNARYAPMSIAVAPGFSGPWWRRLLASQLIVDESWALSARGGGRFDVPILLGAGLVLYPAWVLSTAVGTLAGDLIGDPARLGLDAAFPALFLALLVPMIRTRRALAAALLGGAIALALIPVAAPGVPIIAASVACLLGWRRSSPEPAGAPG
jgi:4-azaleucine resistance transporter AzlC